MGRKRRPGPKGQVTKLDLSAEDKTTPALEAVAEVLALSDDDFQSSAATQLTEDPYPDRPDVIGDHYGRFEYLGPPSVFDKPIGGEVPRCCHRHKVLGFPESQFAEIEETGLFKWRGWGSV